MRILHVVRVLDPRDGGPPSVVHGLVQAGQQQGDEVLVVTCEPCPPESPPNGTRVVNLAHGRRGGERQLVEFRPEAVIVHGVWGSHVRWGARWARRRGVPYAVAAHGALSRYGLSQKALRKRLALRLVYRRLLSRAAFIITNSAAEREDVLERGLQVPVELVPHGLSERVLADGGMWEMAAAPSVPPTILFLGRLSAVKDPLLLVRAFALLAQRNAEVRLRVAGPDAGEGGAIAALVGRLPPSIAQRVHVVGSLHGEEKWRALRECQMLCLPSRYESFGMVLIEALSQERPVVYSPECGFPEIAASGAGLIAARSASALAEALETYLAPARARAAGERGRELVRARYTWKGAAATLRQLLIERSGLPPPQDGMVS